MSVNSELVVIALGANLPSDAGAPRETLEKALALLDGGGVSVAATAPWRRTPAFPPGSGPEYVNGAAVLRTAHRPSALLARLHEVERELGRERRARWGPRVCDLDLIAYGARIAPDAATLRRLMALGAKAAQAPAPEALILPHPRMHERAFVLAPMADIAPAWRHPVLGRTTLELLADLPQKAREEATLL